MHVGKKADEKEKQRRRRRVNAMRDAVARMSPARPPITPLQMFAPAKPPPGVGPKDGTTIAMDSLADFNVSAAWAASALGTFWSEGLTFPGFPYLAELAQRPEYRKMAEKLAMHATRNWIKLKSKAATPKKAVTTPTVDPISGQVQLGASGETTPDADANDNRLEKISKMESEMERTALKEIFRTYSEQDSFFGRSHIFVDLGSQEPDELLTSIGDGPSAITAAKIPKGGTLAFRNVEAVWCYPQDYNTNNPLSPAWYNPGTWYVMSQRVHKTRLLTFCSRVVPDLLKPAYSFGGLSLSQLAKPYVDNWIRTRQAVSDLIHSFSVMGIKTDLGETLAIDGDELVIRAMLFNATRDNKGLMMLANGVDGEAEEFFQSSVPLSSLDKLQAQAEEQMCYVADMPLIVLLGLSPAGLSATSDSEIKTFYSWIKAYQEKLSPHLKTCLDFIQLQQFGEIDPDITFVWADLNETTDKEQADLDKANADADVAYITAGVLDPVEVREALAANPESRYGSINVDDVPEGPMDPGAIPPGGEGDDDSAFNLERDPDNGPERRGDPSKRRDDPGAEGESGRGERPGREESDRNRNRPPRPRSEIAGR